MYHYFRVWSSLNSTLPKSIENDEYYKEMIGKLDYFEKEFKVKKVLARSLKINNVFSIIRFTFFKLFRDALNDVAL